MNKSKFLKKSLAAVLSVLLIVAMIPLSAAAAYEPTVEIIPASGFSGTVSGSGQKWNIDFDYVAGGTPKINVKTNKNTDQISQIKADGTATAFAVAYNKSTGAVTDLVCERDKVTNEALPIIFEIRDNTDDTKISARYEVIWEVKKTPDAVSVKSAKLDSYVGDVVGNTITFTVPFGYMSNSGNGKSVNIQMNGVKTQNPAAAFGSKSGVVETNKTKGVAEKWTWELADGNGQVTYEVSVVEEKGLESIKIGDYVGEFEKEPSGADEGYETGTINFKVPADIAADNAGELNLPIELGVGSHYSKVFYSSSATDVTTAANEIKSGDKVDFADLLATTPSKKFLNFVSTGTGNISSYTLVFVKNNTDTILTGVVAEPGTGHQGTSYGKIEGTINSTPTTGTINIVVPKGADLTKVKLTFTGPKVADSSTPKIAVASAPGTAGSFGTTGVTDGTAPFAALDCSSPVRLVVTAANGTTQKYYTLTVTEADMSQVKPNITAAKLVLGKGTDDEKECVGNVDTPNKTITFTVPHSTADAIVGTTGNATTEYTFAKSQSCSIDESGLGSATIHAGGTVKVTAYDGDSLTYTVKYALATAQTGKSISNFVLTSSDNKYEIDYNNNKKFAVTATSDGKFKVTADKAAAANYYYANFELSKGAKMFLVPASESTDMTTAGYTEVKPGDSKTGKINPDSNGAAQMISTATTQKYFIASEELATLITKKDSKVSTYQKIKNAYTSMMTEYVFEVTNAPRTGNYLGTTLSADDGKVTGTANDGKITLTVPWSYANATAAAAGATTAKCFFLDYTTSPGATVKVTDGTNTGYVYSGGHVTYNVAEKKVKTDSKAWTANTAFAVVGDATTGYKLYTAAVGAGSSNVVPLLSTDPSDTALYKIVVTSESDVAKDYFIEEIKVADAKIGASITAATVNGTAATINESAETITANVPFGTNLGKIKLALTASEMATVTIGGTAFDPDKTYDLRNPLKITVTSEDGNKTTVYTLTVTMGDQFSDVPANSWFAPYVKQANDLGIVKGYSDGTFKPYNNISRQDFALMTVRMLGLEDKVDNNATIAFSDSSDVRADARGAVAYLSDEGILGGYTNGTFKPNKTITRQEAAKILAVALDIEANGNPSFADGNSISTWAKPYVAACQAYNIFTGDNADRFNPAKNITRAETAKVMVKSYEVNK